MSRPIAFYAPLKSPDHAVPSGDRLMARQLIAALRMGNNEVTLASTHRSYLRDPHDTATADQIRAEANAEVARLETDWRANGPPALWLCYHPYYKSPDLIGPALCRRFNLPYVTVESSWSARRNIGLWADAQNSVLLGLKQAALNICLTRRDRIGLIEGAPDAITADLPPFIDPAPFLSLRPRPEPGRLITVAMMRSGDKAASFAFLARSLHLIRALPWHLTLIGDGPDRPATESLFAAFGPRIDWTGALPSDAIARHLARASLYLWPGIGEAYGLAYLEAQAVGIPVIALNTAGVPEVVAHGITGLLTPPGDPVGYAAAIRDLLTDDTRRNTLAAQTRSHVTAHHAINAAAATLATLLDKIA